MPKIETLRINSSIKLKVACHKCDEVLNIEYIDYYDYDSIYELEVSPCPNCCIGDK